MSMPSTGTGSYQTIGGAPPNTLPGGFQPQLQPQVSDNLGGYPMPPAGSPEPQYAPQPQQQYAPQPFAQQQRPPQFAAQPFAPPQQQGPPARSMSGSPMGGDPMFGQTAGASAWAPTDDLTLGGPAGGFQPIMQQQPPRAPQQPQPNGFAGGYPQQQFPQQGPQQPPSTLIRDALAQRGVLSAGQYESDDAVLQELAGAAMEAGHLRQMAALGNEYLRQQSSGGAPQQQQLPQQPQLPAPTQQPAGGQAKPQAPEWRPEWASFVRLDPESGAYVARDPMATNPLVVMRANERATWEREQRRRMEEDPVGYLRERGLDEVIQKVRDDTRTEVMGSVQQILRSRESQAEMGQWAERNMPRFIAAGPDGAPARNPYTGEFLFNPRGQAAQRYSADFRQRFQQTYGRQPDHTTLIEHVETSLARDEAMGAFGQQQFAPPNGYQQPGGYAPVQPQASFLPPNGHQNGYQNGYQQPVMNQNEAMKNNLIQRAINSNGAFWQPGAGGTVAAAVGQAGVPQNPRLNLTQMLQQGAVARGIAHPEQF